MPGTFIRASAIMPPGMFLSQPPTTSTPSMAWPFTLVSIASAITSRETSEYFIASVPMPMPSVTVGKPNTCGIAPAALSDAMARSTSGWMPALQGFIVECPLATPTMGFSKSPSPKPTARSMARFGERATPCVIRRERRLALMMRKSPRGDGRRRGPPKTLSYNGSILAQGLSSAAAMLVHPQFDPVAFAIGPVAVRWYGLMYLVGVRAVRGAGEAAARGASSSPDGTRRTSTTCSSTACSA